MMANPILDKITKLNAEIEQLRAEITSLRADRRESIAATCLSGLLADPEFNENYPSDAARVAIKYADALIAELDKEPAS